MNNLTHEEQLIVRRISVATVRIIQAARAASDVRYEASPSSAAARGAGPDPTGSTVTDTLRWNLTEALTSALQVSAASAGMLEMAADDLEAATRHYYGTN